MKLLFYKVLLWMAEYELAVAITTGRSKHSIALIRDDVANLTKVVDNLTVQHDFAQTN